MRHTWTALLALLMLCCAAGTIAAQTSQHLSDDRDKGPQPKTEDTAGPKDLAESVRDEVLKAYEDAETDATHTDPVIEKITEENILFSDELTDIEARLENARVSLEETESSIVQVGQDFDKVKQKVEIAGKSRAIGQVLLQERYRLPDISRIFRENRKRQKELADIWLRQLQLDEKVASFEERKLATLKAMDAVQATEEISRKKASVQDRAEELLESQHYLVTKLRDSYSRYHKMLGNLEIAKSRLGGIAVDFAGFLDERILWVPSTFPMGMESIQENIQVTGRLLSFHRWRDVGNAVVYDIKANPHIMFLALLVIILLLLRRKRLFEDLEMTSARLSKPLAFRFSHTFRAMLVSLILALPGPLLLLYAGWRLSVVPETTTFVQAAGAALTAVAMPYLYFQTFYVVCRKNGIAAVHLQWSATMLSSLRRNLPWFIALFLSAIALVTFMWNTDHSYRGRTGVPVFIVAMVSLTVFIRRIVKARQAGEQTVSQEQARGWRTLFRRFWYPFITFLPLMLAVAAARGYFFTAVEIARHLHVTVWLIVGAFILHNLFLRWLVVDRYRLAVKRAQEKRAAKASTADAGADGVPEKVDIQKINLQTVSHQTGQLLNFLIVLSVAAGLWLIWSEILPAFKILKQVSIWQSTVVVDGQAVQEKITLAHVALALVFIAVTALLVRNIPSFLEITLLQRLPLTSGARYTVTKITQYAFVTVGSVAIFNAMGGSWSSIQWLVAALGVGLGFGLQEIFGNFISGLIILFERPIRVGDTVTVGDVSGTVSRIRIRATTITDWDNKELIVPNKTFITEQLINWTLSDPITRLKITVGVAYGSDTVLTHRVIKEVVTANPLVLDTPEPKVYFTGFGDSSLDFLVYVFIKDISYRFTVVHEVHMAIEKTLREHGITIPFPQRDVHIRSAEGLERSRGAPPADENEPKP